MKITSGSAAGAGTPKGSTTGAETAGFGAAGAAAGDGGKAGSSRSAITNEAGGGCAARRNLKTPSTELRRTGQEAAKTEVFEGRAVRNYAWQHAGPAGRNLTDLDIPVLRANYVCSENTRHCVYKISLFSFNHVSTADNYEPALPGGKCLATSGGPKTRQIFVSE